MNNLKMQRRIVSKFAATLVVAFALLVAAFFSGCFLFGERDSRKWVINTVKENYYFYDEMNKDGLDDLSIAQVVERLDRYSDYYTRDEIQQIIKENSGEKAGIGFSYSYLAAGESSLYPEGGCLIVNVVGNSPAKNAGMKAGRILVAGSCDGEQVSFKEEGALENFIDKIEKGKSLTLTDSSGNNYEVSKAEYTASYMYMATKNGTYMPVFDKNGDVNGLKNSEDGALEYLPEDTAYIKMSQFYGGAADEFSYLMGEFTASGYKSLIFDLRDNGGGYVDVMGDLAGYFVPEANGGRQVSMTAEYKSGRKEIFYCQQHARGRVPEGTKLYVLANSGTASASEALIGVLISYNLLSYENIFLSNYGEEFLSWAGEGVKTGRSYGKGIMQSTFTNYFTGEALKLTTAQIYWPNNKCIHDKGLTAADGCRLIDTDWIVTPDDAELKKVVETISQT